MPAWAWIIIVILVLSCVSFRFEWSSRPKLSKAEKKAAIELYDKTHMYLATHHDLPEDVHDLLIEHAGRLRQTFTLKDLEHYAEKHS